MFVQLSVELLGVLEPSGACLLRLFIVMRNAQIEVAWLANGSGYGLLTDDDLGVWSLTHFLDLIVFFEEIFQKLERSYLW